MLNEISVCKTPANSDAYCTIAKSYDVKKNKETKVAKTIQKNFESMMKVDSDEFPSLIQFITFDKTITKSCSYDECSEKYDEIMTELCDECCETPIYDNPSMLSPEDITLMVMISRIIQTIDLSKVTKPERLTDREYIDTMPAECFIP